MASGASADTETSTSPNPPGVRFPPQPETRRTAARNAAPLRIEAVEGFPARTRQDRSLGVSSEGGKEEAVLEKAVLGKAVMGKAVGV
jgi:hypothetical protein